MEITLTRNAMDILKEKAGTHSKLALALIDSKDPFLRDKGACAKGSFFQIIPFLTEFGQYVTRIEHPSLDIYTSQNEQCYLGKSLIMDYDQRLNSFSLENEIAVLDHNIKLNNCFFS
ncbi:MULTISPECIES: iron-sulfur cluster biosynthesis family protein [Enterococcus]|uniref:Core domain-containing protein n=1 Tax=Candidatus Enterococcus mangumiae TaxID=2230878 RepID=A0ABZ2SZG8_9ENTE|nr:MULTISPECIES: iron-sulfur cluster biosynthesis family protein [unclassified Enterococcus]MBO0462864.1 iron-sulfur cluster biosynthesis family protein [Enterococcus sp. DIV1298c]MBO0491098.1 iron-sulfur cluster biosynthesis family protein [Enterococcus sp. DIV1094]MBO1300498.1 iron-sulfur cluster biosynthesis family protein [Enterococcus sp. DIV1271a]